MCFSLQTKVSEHNGQLSLLLKMSPVRTSLLLSVLTKVNFVLFQGEVHLLLIVADCTNPPGGFDASKMHFTPTSPHVGTTTKIQCSSGFFPRPSTTPNQTSGPDIDPNLSPGQYRCDGKRQSTGEADPSQYRSRLSTAASLFPIVWVSRENLLFSR